MEKVTLYKRNAKSNIIKWEIQQINENIIKVTHGILNKVPVIDYINVTKKKVNELESRVNAKRKEGYKALEDLYDNAPTNIDENRNLYKFLDTYLPKYNTTDEGFVLPMLAKTLEDNKPFEKYGTMLGQYKINGLRCIVGAERSDDMFDPIKLTYTSREGTRWELPHMDYHILHYLSSELIERMVEEGVCLDGELYIPGYSVNQINSFVKNNALPQHKQLQYWCYDIAMEDTIAGNRQSYLVSSTHPMIQINCYSENYHKGNNKRFVTLPNFEITDIRQAYNYRDQFIQLGFEGLILRNPNAEYAFGKRNQSMFKFKKIQDGLFKIVNIEEDKRGLPIYTLQNDINDELFQCTLNNSQKNQKFHLQIKDKIIGKMATVEYRERSGVKEVPFHAKIVFVHV